MGGSIPSRCWDSATTESTSQAPCTLEKTPALQAQVHFSPSPPVKEELTLQGAARAQGGWWGGASQPSIEVEETFGAELCEAWAPE